MPALPNAAKILKVEVSGTFGTATFANIFHCRYSGTAPSVSDLVTFNSDFMTAFLSNAFTLQSDQAEVTNIISTDLTTTSSARAEDPVTGATGTNTGDPSAASVAAVISWKISRRYRGGHPRTYMVGITDDMLTSVTAFNPTYIGNLQSGANAFLNDVNAISVGAMGVIELGQLSYYTNNAPRVTPLFDAFIAGTVNSRIDSQRRRLGR